MATNFPTSIDSFTNPTSGDTLDSPSHSAQHANINDAMVAVQTKLGVGSGTIGAYTAHTPTFNGFTLGNGTVTSRYTKINDYVHWWGYVTLGSTSTMTGPLDIALPVTAVGGIVTSNSACSFFNFLNVYWGTTINIATTSIRMVSHIATGTYAYNGDIAPSVPFTWATGHSFYWNHFYEAA